MANRKTLTLMILAIPFAVFLTGCSGGVNGEGTNTYSQTNGTPIVRAANFNDQGWSLFERGQYESALTTFNQVLGDNPTAEEEAEANNGVGWARGRIGQLKDGIPWFLKAVGLSHDAKVGLAGAYIQSASKADLEAAADLLFTKLGGGNPHFHYVPRRSTGVSDAEAHAMLAYCYAAVGKSEDAITQLDYAKELNPAWASSTIDQISRMVDFLQM